MLPYRPLTIDNRQPVAQFVDGSPLTDGMANLAASLMNAGPAAAQIRQQKQQRDLENLWRQQQVDRQGEQDAMAALWHDQTMQRQGEQDSQAAARHVETVARQKALDELAAKVANANISNMEADNQRKNLGMFGTGLDNTAKRGIEILKLLFGGGGKAAPRKERPNVRNFGSTDMPDWRQWDAEAEQWAPVELPEQAAPAPTSLSLSGAEKAIMTQARESMNVAETGYPDREFNFYHPADWFRSAPAAPAAPAQDAQDEDSIDAADAPAPADAQEQPSSGGILKRMAEMFSKVGPGPGGSLPYEGVKNAEMQRRGDETPEMLSAGINGPGLDAWHNLYSTNGQAFQAQMAQLLKADPAKYAVIYRSIKNKRNAQAR